MKAGQPGEPVQIDHMTVHADGRAFKQLHAKDPIAKALHARACSGATARAVADFLDAAAKRMPIRSVNEALKDCLDDHHEVRPRQALGWLTPNQFRDTLGVAA